MTAQPATDELPQLSGTGTSDPDRVIHMIAAPSHLPSITCCGFTTITMPPHEYLTRTPAQVNCGGCRERIHLGYPA